MFSFFKKNIYDISSLYAASFGMIHRKKNNFYIRGIEKVVIIEKISKENDNPYGISPITHVKYLYARDWRLYLPEYVGQVMINKEMPLSLFTDKQKLTIKEIQELENNMNNPKSKEKDIQDPIMQEIKKLADQAKLILNESIKQNIIVRITVLGNSYVARLISIRTNQNSGPTIEEAENDLVNSCFEEIRTIANDIKKELENNSLLRDLAILQRSLKNKKNE